MGTRVRGEDLDAAHDTWKQAGGPDVVGNGISMYVPHQRAFDWGALTIYGRYRVLGTADLGRSNGVIEHFHAHHERRIREPHARELLPRGEYLEVHGRELFRKPARGEGGGAGPGSPAGAAY